MTAVATAETGVPARRSPRPGPLGGKMFIPLSQRTRLLDTVAEVIAEQGLDGFRPKWVCGRAGMSGRTFYDLFADREDCLLALFDRELGEIADAIRPAYEEVEEKDWEDRVRAGLSALLSYLDGHPDIARFVFVEAMGAGPRVLARRARALDSAARAVDAGRRYRKGHSRPSQQPPPLTAENVVGGVFSVIHARICLRADKKDAGSLSELLNSLMAAIVLPYRNQSAAQRELNRRSVPWDLPVKRAQLKRVRVRRERGVVPSTDFRLTYRTLAVLRAIADRPGASNQGVAAAAGIKDEGQASKLLAKLARLRVIENTGPGYPSGAPNEWRLTKRGRGIVREAEQGEAVRHGA
jgi:AcrR family transcriptional regulator